MNDHMRDDDINHHSTSLKTPLTADAFVKSDEEKIDLIEGHFQGIMKTLGLDLEDDSLKGTPHRVAKMYVTETFAGLHPDRKPALNTFDNSYQYSEMLVEKDIVIYSTCEHHFMPIIGRAHIAYMSNDRVIGLSKMNRIVDYYAKRPQVQERLTRQVASALIEALGTNDIAVVISAKHLCVNARGIRDRDSSTVTAEYNGRFKENESLRQEFLRYIEMETDHGDT
jgi:GTP cyclohydrolase I